MPAKKKDPCAGKTGDALADCLDVQEAKSSISKARTLVQSKAQASVGGYVAPGNQLFEGASAKSATVGTAAIGAGGMSKFEAQATGQSLPGASGPTVLPCRLSGPTNGPRGWRFYQAWRAFLRRNDYLRLKYYQPVIQQIKAIDVALAKLDEENSLESKVGRFFSNPLALISAAIAAYATMGASLGATVAGIVKDDDSIDAAIAKMGKLRSEVDAQARRWFAISYPASGDQYFPVGVRKTCPRSRGGTSALGQGGYRQDSSDGTDPVPPNFRLWLEEEFG